MGDDLNDRIAKAQAELDAQKRPALREKGGGAGLGLRMASDFTAAIIVGAVIGWGVDAFSGWSPWGLIVCLVLGFIAGVRMIVRAANDAGKAKAAGGTNDGMSGGIGGKGDGA